MNFGFARSVHPYVMLGGTIAWDYESFDPEGGSGASVSGAGLLADLTVNLPGSETVVPYLQLSVGPILWSSSGEGDLETTFVIPLVGAGMRVLVSDHAALQVLAAFEHQNSPLGVDDATSTELTLRFGFSVFPGGVQ